MCIIVKMPLRAEVPAGPTRRGGVLQWGSVEGEVTRPELPPGVLTPQDSWAPAGEDADAGPSTEVSQKFIPILWHGSLWVLSPGTFSASICVAAWNLPGHE